VRQRPNLLLLDEPTNHLDIEMREALTEALQDYGGALVVVAHDRHLLRATTDVLWLVADGQVAPFDGDLDDYREWVLIARRRERADTVQRNDTATTGAAAVDRKAQKREEAKERQRLADARKPFLRKQAALERDMAALTAEKSELDAWLASEAAYTETPKEDLKARIARQGDVAWQLARLESEWLEVAEALEKVGTDVGG
jgi:ATP-binding cassette subfamily F protein 3